MSSSVEPRRWPRHGRRHRADPAHTVAYVLLVIPASVLPTLFHPYTRGPDTRQPGLGLGLATGKRLAEAHGGEAGVVSAEGSRSTFWFELPGA